MNNHEHKLSYLLNKNLFVLHAVGDPEARWQSGIKLIYNRSIHTWQESLPPPNPPAHITESNMRFVYVAWQS